MALVRGKDFTEVVLGISVAALPDLCGDLLARDARFKEHVEVLARATTATQAMQLWTVQGKKPQQPNPIIVPFVEPYDTIADMSQLLPVEAWPAGAVGGVHYLCSAIAEQSPPPDRADARYPGQLLQSARDQGLAWVTRQAPVLWANARTPGGGFDWSVLHDPEGRDGAARFDAQWVSTPGNLSDRYVLPTPGSYAVRLKSNETAFLNLYLAGDWIRTSLSIGCFEATAMSGIQAARALAMETGNAEVPRARGDWIDDVRPRTTAVSPAPRYRQRDGELLAPPPYQVDCKDLFLFVLEADENKLQAVCDNELNLGGPRFAPAGRFVVLYAAALEDLSMGISCTAREIGLWMPVVTSDRGVSSIRMYSPYVWLSSATSTIAGRSVFGYTKQTAAVVVPSQGDALVLDVSGDTVCPGARPGSRVLQQRPILHVAPPAPAAWARPGSDLAHGAAMAELLVRIATELVTFDPLKTIEELLSSLGGMRSIFLKQFPAARGDAPSYQALVEATIAPTLTTVSGTGLPGPWTVTLPAYDSPRIVETLGLRARFTTGPDLGEVATVVPVGQAWMTFQGSMSPGDELWRA